MMTPREFAEIREPHGDQHRVASLLGIGALTIKRIEAGEMGNPIQPKYEHMINKLEFFRFLPGEKLKRIVGMPGPDYDDCELIEDDGGPTVKIRSQVWGSGPFHEKEVRRDSIAWLRDSPTSSRYQKWLEETAARFMSAKTPAP